QLDDGRTRAAGRLDLSWVGIDEQGRPDPRIVQAIHSIAHAVKVSHNIQPAFCRQLFASFGNQTDIVGTSLARKLQHLGRDCTFKVHPGAQLGSNGRYISVLNVPPVFAQMKCDQVSTRLFSNDCGANRIGIRGEPLLAQGCNVVDIDAKLDHFSASTDTPITGLPETGSSVFSTHPPPSALYSSTRLSREFRPV